MTHAQFRFSIRNAKLLKHGIATINIPAFRSEDGFITCPNAGVCASVCYARQGRFMFGLAKLYAEENLALIRDRLDWKRRRGDNWLITQLATQIDALPKRYRRFRPHASGDFFDPRYYDVWLEVARQLPAYEFHAYTKQISATHERRRRLDALGNFHIIQSVGGKEDDLIDTSYAHSRIFLNAEQLEASGYVNGTEAEEPAFTRVRRIGLVYHGTRKVTPQQGKALTELRVA